MSKESSAFGIDTWPLGEFSWQGTVSASDALRTSAEHNLTVLDTSPVYGNGQSEFMLGKIFDEFDRPDDFFVTTKVGLDGNSTGNYSLNGRPEFLFNQVQSSLDRMNLDSVDLIQLHGRDPEVPFGESLEALEEMVDRGYAEHTGFVLGGLAGVNASRLPAADFVRVPFNLFDYLRFGDNLVQELLERYRVIVYDPLCGGLVSQHYADINEKVLDHEIREHHPKFTTNRVHYIRCLRRIQEYFLDRGRDELHLESVGLAWLKENYDFDSILFGVRSSNDIAHVKSARNLSLRAEEWRTIEAIVDETVEASEPPYFVQPPPALPRHSFERHVLDESCRCSFAEPQDVKPEV